MADPKYTLGTKEASEQLIADLYIDLRKKVNKWSSITQQTAQARMGYIGQHLVSVATGFPGGRSGARGKDLLLPGDNYAEIKTCYRVDQLGKCNNCAAAVSSIEPFCPDCGSTDLKRNDDSKWLIGIRHDAEFAAILEPQYYYLVLFEFTNLASPNTIKASIWRVDSSAPGFSYCMVDYYRNIRAASSSKAPFNLWPYQLKFDIMRPVLIYRSLITCDDKVNTEIFPGVNSEIQHPLQPLNNYAASTNLTKGKILLFAKAIGAKVNEEDTKNGLLTCLHNYIKEKNIRPEIVADELAHALYWEHISSFYDTLPSSIKERTTFYK